MTSSPNTLEDGWIERFEAFARSKPADETYHPTNSHNCAHTQFCTTDSIPPPEAARRFWLLSERLQEAILGPEGDTATETFGDLADRLAAYRVEPGK